MIDKQTNKTERQHTTGVWYEGLEEPILIYISFYDKEPLYIPHGFTKK